MSPDGRNVASGDRSGNIRILDASNMEQMYKIEAHDAEVLCLEYCGNENDVSYMASASRDRLLHVFDAKVGIFRGGRKLIYLSLVGVNFPFMFMGVNFSDQHKNSFLILLMSIYT